MPGCALLNIENTDRHRSAARQSTGMLQFCAYSHALNHKSHKLNIDTRALYLYETKGRARHFRQATWPPVAYLPVRPCGPALARQCQGGHLPALRGGAGGCTRSFRMAIRQVLGFCCSTSCTPQVKRSFGLGVTVCKPERAACV